MKCEKDTHPLCGWVAKIIPKILQTWYNRRYNDERRIYGKPDEYLDTYKMDIEYQEKNDIALDKLSVKEYEDSFKCSK